MIKALVDSFTFMEHAFVFLVLASIVAGLAERLPRVQSSSQAVEALRSFIEPSDKARDISKLLSRQQY